MGCYAISKYCRSALPLSLTNAIRHPFYERHWSSAADLLRNASAADFSEIWALFRSLPLVSKDDLRVRIAPQLTEGDRIDSITHTTGSTGTHAFRYRSRLETEQIRALSRRAYADVMPAPDRLRPITMRLDGPFHGTIGGASRAFDEPYMYECGVWDDFFVERTFDALRRQFAIPGFDTRIRHIFGAVQYVRVLTQCLIDQGIDSSDFAVKGIGLYGGYVSQEVYEQIQSYWRTAPVEIFGVSEMTGATGAPKCRRCGALTFEPHVVPDLVGFSDDSPVDVGPGRLVLSELLPYGLCQPLLRYLNGDIAEWVPADEACAGHRGAIRHLGRLGYSVFHSDPRCQELLVGSNALREACYSPWVEKTQAFTQLDTLRDKRSVGSPIAELRWREDDVPELQLAFAPSSHARECDTDMPAVAVRERLESLCQGLRAAVQARTLRFEAVADASVTAVLSK